MKDFNHSNVLSLLGVAIKDNKQPFVILPYMEHGDLKSYISNPDRVCFDSVHCIFQLEKNSFLYLLRTIENTLKSNKISFLIDIQQGLLNSPPLNSSFSQNSSGLFEGVMIDSNVKYPFN